MALKSTTGRPGVSGALSALHRGAVCLTFHKPHLDILCVVGAAALVYSFLFALPPIVGYGLSVFVFVIGLSALSSSYRATIYHLENFVGYISRPDDTYWVMLGQAVFWKWWSWFILRGLLVLGIAILLFPPTVPFLKSAHW